MKKKLLTALIGFSILASVSAQTTVPQGGTGTTTFPGGTIVIGSSTLRLSSTFQLFWDWINSRLGIGSSTPTATLTVVGSGSANPFTVATSTGASLFSVDTAGNATVSNGLTVTGNVIKNNIYRPAANNGSIQIYDNAFSFTSAVANGLAMVKMASTTNAASGGVTYGVTITPTYNQTAGAGATDLLINRKETAVGTGTQLLFDAQVNSLSKFVITNAGNLGIATTTPIQKFSVVGSSYFKGAVGINALADTSIANLRVDGTGASSSATFINGNVGIGTTTPSQTLDVAGIERISRYTNGRFLEFNGLKGIGGRLDINGTNSDNFAITGSSTLTLATEATAQALKIISNGNVGIGTTTPGSLLSVQGNSYFGGNIFATGTLGILGNTSLVNASATAMSISGPFYDSVSSAGTLGQVLWSTGTSTQWVATSSLGITSGTTYTGTYPIIVSGTVISTGFSTSTVNSYSQQQTFVNASSTNFTVSGQTYLATTTVTGNETINTGASGTSTASLGQASNPGCVETYGSAAYSHMWMEAGTLYVTTGTCQ